MHHVIDSPCSRITAARELCKVYYSSRSSLGIMQLFSTILCQIETFLLIPSIKSNLFLSLILFGVTMIPPWLPPTQQPPPNIMSTTIYIYSRAKKILPTTMNVWEKIKELLILFILDEFTYLLRNTSNSDMSKKHLVLNVLDAFYFSI